jgi:hypothetical protein
VSAFASPSPSKLSRYSRYGSWQVLSEAEFRRGLVSDTAPVALPAGAIVDVRDYLFDRPGRARKRGGSAYYGPAIVSHNTMTHVASVPFQAGDKLIAVSAVFGTPGSYHASDVNASAYSDLGPLGGDSPNPPVFYNDRLYILSGHYPGGGRPAIVSNAAGTCTVANSAATVPGQVGCVHAGYLVLANDASSQLNRLWFSPVPDPETAWDTANAYIDTNGPITALASIQGVLVVFHAGSCERILGSIPPGTPGENMSLQPLSGQAGCFSPGVVRALGGNVYFADSSGVWVTNGASVSSVSSRADGTGVSSLWRTSISAGPALGHPQGVRAGAFGNDYYLIQIYEGGLGSGFWGGRLSLLYHISTGIWSRLAIEVFGDFSPSGTVLETYAAPINQARLVKLSDLFADQPLNAADADGTAVLPTLTSRVMGSGPFLKAFGDGHLTYDMRSDVGATLALTYSRDIEQQAFQASATFAGVGGPTRQRFPVSGDGHGFSWTIAQTGASSKTELYAVELEHRNYEEQADL